MLLDVATCCYSYRFVGQRVADDSSIHLHRGRGIRGTVVAQLRVLEAFGVSPVAEMVYLAMLEHPADGVSALAEQVGVSATVVKESLALIFHGG